MSRWVVGIPVWGERYVRTFIEVALPFHRAAVQHYGGDVMYVFHTDHPHLLHEATEGLTRQILPCPPDSEGYARFGVCHMLAMHIAQLGDRVAPLCADQILSVECFAAAERRFQTGMQAVCWLGHRTTGVKIPHPGVKAVELNRWAMGNRHPVIAELFWPTGRSACPSILYFERGDSIVMRAFGLGPFAFVKTEGLYFEGTIDNDLASRFDKKRIHVVTEPGEMSCATIDDASLTHGVFAQPLTTAHVAAWAAYNTNDTHRWFLTHRCRIQGYGECADQPVIDEILDALPQYEIMLRDIMHVRGNYRATHGHG